MKGLLIFIAGTAVGVFCTKATLERKYEKLAQDEIEAMEKVFSSRAPSDEHVVEEETYVEMVYNLGYKQESKNQDDISGIISIISPEEWGARGDYAESSLTYYADGVLTDEYNEPIENAVSSIGEYALRHFGEYADDVVHVRNDATRCYYEILRDLRRYEDVKEE